MLGEGQMKKKKMNIGKVACDFCTGGKQLSLSALPKEKNGRFCIMEFFLGFPPLHRIAARDDFFEPGSAVAGRGIL